MNENKDNQIIKIITNSLYKMKSEDELSDELLSKFYNWDKGDCSDIGFLKILLLHFLKEKKENPYFDYETEINDIKMELEKLKHE